MERTRTWILALLVLLVLAAACGNGLDEGADQADNGEAAAPGEFTRTVEEGSGEGLAFGYLSGGESIPFVKLVSDGIQEAADRAGAEILFCDGELDPAKALECARTFEVQDLDAVANWQFAEDAAPEVCEAYGNLPTVAIDAPQPPCEEVFVGANNREAGMVLGRGLGEYVEAEFGCEFDAYVSLEIPQLPDVNEARLGGSRAGFEDVCGDIDDDRFIVIDTGAGGGGPTENTRRQFADILTTLPDAERIVVVSVNDDSLLGAFAAADTTGRSPHLYGGAHGADPTSWQDIRTNPNWIGDVAYFPEQYGELVVAALIALARGQEVPSEVLIEHEFITADNIDQHYPG